MSAKQFATFLDALGHKVCATESSWWFEVARGFYESFPFHRPIQPSESELQHVIGMTGIGARYACPIEAGKPSFLYACDDKHYSLEHLSGNGRSKIRRALKRCDVRRVGFDELEPAGALEVSRDTIMRQGRSVARSHDQYWRDYFRAASHASTFEAWAAFVDGNLAAFLLAVSIEDAANILIVRSHRRYLQAYPNNALLYAYLMDALSRPELALVSYGLESIQSLDTLDAFKGSVGFRKLPIGQRIHAASWLRPMLCKPMISVARKVIPTGKRSERWRKVGGMLEWYATQPCVEADSGRPTPGLM